MKLFKIKLALFSLSLLHANFILAQQTETFKAKDVIEHGIPIKYGNKLFIRVEDQTLAYDVNHSPKDFTALQDSVIFLVNKNGLNIYLRPLNPLKFSFKGENKIMIDPVNAAALAAFTEIQNQAKKVTKNLLQETLKAKGLALDWTPIKIEEDCEYHDSITNRLLKLQQDLQANNDPTPINDVFNKLKSMSFKEENSTKLSLAANLASLKIIEDRFYKIEKDIINVKDKIKPYPCDDKYVMQYIFNDILKELISIWDEQLKRLNNLRAAYTKVEEVYTLATTDPEGMKWVIQLNRVPVGLGSVSVYKLMIKQSGLELSEKGEIVAATEKDILNQTIRFRKFQRFVPEIAAGTAYTFFKYNEYGTMTDANGVQRLAASGQKSINNLNFTTMINFVYYTPNSDLHLLYQLGIGANAEVPTLFSGFGIRSNINGIKRIAISGGVAFTWVKELTKLKIGDEITGTADIEKDLTHQFSWPPKPYVGIQLNF